MSKKDYAIGLLGWFGIIAVIFLTGAKCEGSMNDGPPHEPDPPTLGPQPTPEANQGSAAEPPVEEIICYETNVGNSWPVERQVQHWNSNPNNVLFEEKEHNSVGCDFNLTIKETIGFIDFNEQEDAIGMTVREDYTTFTVKLSAQAEDPIYRAHITCHELGHVMGVDHVDNPRSCMSDGQERFATEPMWADLEAVDVREGAWWRVE